MRAPSTVALSTEHLLHTSRIVSTASSLVAAESIDKESQTSVEAVGLPIFSFIDCPLPADAAVLLAASAAMQMNSTATANETGLPSKHLARRNSVRFCAQTW